MPDLAPGWQLRCPKCNWTLPYGKIGIRLGAASRGKRILARCPQCRRLRWVIVERVSTSPRDDNKN